MQEPSEEHFKQIGRAVVMFHRIEVLMRLIAENLSSSLDLEGEGFSVVAKKAQSAARESAELTEEQRSRLQQWIRDAVRVNDMRVQMVHSTWSPIRDGGAVLLHRRRSERRVAILSAHDIELQADLIQGVMHIGVGIARDLSVPGFDPSAS